MLSSPDVTGDAAGEPASVVEPVDGPSEEESPTAETAFPPTVTGAFRVGSTWLPLAMPSSPEVVDDPAEAGTEDPSAVEPDDDESPSTLTLLPHAFTGAATTGDT